jgi:peroxiredoxin
MSGAGTHGATSIVGEVPASTGGVVDLDRILGRIPVAIVFVEAPERPESRELLRGLGERLADFGRDRIQVLMASPVGQPDLEHLEDGIEGHARMLSDPERELARHFGVEYAHEGATTVLTDAHGEIAAIWTDQADGTFADSLLSRASQLLV